MQFEKLNVYAMCMQLKNVYAICMIKIHIRILKQGLNHGLVLKKSIE